MMTNDWKNDYISTRALKRSVFEKRSPKDHRQSDRRLTKILAGNLIIKMRLTN